MYPLPFEKQRRSCRSCNRQWENFSFCDTFTRTYSGNYFPSVNPRRLSFLYSFGIFQKRSEPLKKRDVAGLIISPTRELATQTHEVLSNFLANTEKITSLLIVGGNPITDDVEKLRHQGAHIITATPGRLEELLTKNFPEINLHKSLKEIVRKCYLLVNL